MMMTAETISVCYLNVQGLQDEKLLQISNLITSQIIFLAETWYLTYQISLPNDYLIAASTYIPTEKFTRTGKQNGGIYLYIKSSLKPLISSIVEGEYFISLTIFGLTIVAVYLPPSLKDDALDAVLKLLPNADAYIGDWNVRFGLSVSSTSNSTPERLQSISQFTAARDVAFLLPKLYEESCRVDHVFARPFLNARVKVRKKPFENTDHPMLDLKIHLSIPTTTPITDTQSPSTERFSLIELSNDYVKKLFVNTTAYLSSEILSCNIADVDVLDTVILLALQATLSFTCGSYNPSDIKYKADKSLREYSNTENLQPGEASRIFARSKRINSLSHLLQSRNPAVSATNDAVIHFTSLFKDNSNVSLSDLAYIALAPHEFKLTVFPLPNIVAAISNYPAGKSPGLDGLDARVFKSLLDCGPFLQLISQLFSLCLSTGKTPSRWNESVIYPLVKPDKDSRYIDQRRPVALTAMLRRLFEKCLLHYVEEFLYFNAGQAGFRRGHSTLSHALLAAEGSQRGMKHKVFIDLTSAYDRVNLQRLWYKLQLKRFPTPLLATLKSLFTGCRSLIAVNGMLAGPVPRERGLFQGSILSPCLFNVYIDDLADTLNSPLYVSDPAVPSCLLYADDVLIQHHDHSTVSQMCLQVDLWCQLNGMQINISKCGTFSSDFVIGSQPIPIIECYKYLGIPHSPSGLDLQSLMTSSVAKMTSFIGFLHVSTNSLSLSEPAKIAIYRTFARPIVEYGAALVYNAFLDLPSHQAAKLWKQLEDAQSYALAWIFKKKKAKALLLSIAGLEPLRIRFDILSLLFIKHLRHLPSHHPLAALLLTRHCSLITHCLSHRHSSWLELSTTGLKKQINALKLSSVIDNCKLAKYICNTSRTKSAMDFCLLIQNNDLRTNAIQWRTNSIAISKQCYVCNDLFNRAHIIRCGLIPDSLLPDSFIAQYQHSLNLFLIDEYYTPLDHALNIRDYQLFDFLLQFLISCTTETPN